ncbi:MAG: cysteine desulfurase family protein [Pseudomonadota bacterium]
MDYAATTPVAAEVVVAMASCLGIDDTFANVSSNHAFGEAAAERVAAAAEALASAIGAKAASVIWTSGATESDNLAIIGAARYNQRKGKHLVTSRTEHKAVVDAFRYLEETGFEVTWLTPDASGRVSPQQVREALRDDTSLVSMMWVNNETGVINDISGMAAVVADHPALFHVDAAQAFGKISIDLASVPIDFLSVTAHKCYGPKGIGALIMSDKLGVNIEPLLYGGGQQQGYRPGTLPTHQIVGFGAAAALVAQRLESDHAHLTRLGGELQRGLLAVEGVQLNGDADHRLPWLINVSVPGVDGESLLAAMSPVALATGSACNSANAEPSFVLKALGLDDRLAGASLRFSLGRESTTFEVESVVARFEAAVEILRSISGPLGVAS